MAGMCCGVVGGDSETAPLQVESGARAAARRRVVEIRQLKFAAPSASLSASTEEIRRKVQPLEACRSAPPRPRDCESAVENGCGEEGFRKRRRVEKAVQVEHDEMVAQRNPGFGMTSVCGRRRDMEDAVAIHPSFSLQECGSHFFGVYDGHGCSHVSMLCRDRLHEIVKEEIESGGGGGDDAGSWKLAMKGSFDRMDKEVHDWCSSEAKAKSNSGSSCRCELQMPQCDAVGSTAVVAVVTPEKIVVSNCGDSRALLCRNGFAVPLSFDHKPDRPDELKRIQGIGGRVIYWDGARVLGVLAMSRAIGDDYLKPYVIPEPEVTVTDRTEQDECLILASDGLWDVVDNQTACGVVRECLRAQSLSSPQQGEVAVGGVGAEGSDKACADASILLTKLALFRHSTDNISVVVVDLRRNNKL